MSDIMSNNGSAVVAMNGKNCVAIGSDLSFQVERQHIGRIFKVYQITDKILLGLTGLLSDCVSFYQLVRYHIAHLKLTEGRTIQPKSFIHMVSFLLYSKRWQPYFVEVVIAGLDEDGKPYISSSDTVGSMTEPEDFVVGGTATQSLLGAAECFWEKDMDSEALFEATSQTLLSGIDRDSYSGWGAVTYILTPEKLITRYLRSRQD
ncbi:Proteasome subunit beta type-3 [Monocercomonoides exilis]|uniref:Proteasome subunit beta type-3 n=1 Tax=Monocercomonoides exilis TaxID=2049356 RepID=UPI00355969A2|nr:Proteasome subunit beta type-3 [Monocercomonoides exilis]|eukprot:MONOS_6581.1-p1 / transcript=MONOS_6581.1 / gene=MONOS_6581 / organism=Monocercomonoides_exilis_PA203 / gene_product=N-terminal nucleophile aminohydrolase / transcript_product=N-terminal nucleophile aminohydrolase / location=Mono_scaffold00210:10227-11136(-) / protein_length=204 / sequence_SO=supercontig / SO=protein_coding / is_pseudo=false